MANGARGWASNDIVVLIKGGFSHQIQLVMVRLLCHVRAAVACLVVVVWLSYDTQVVQYNIPTTPQPYETFPQLIAMIKWYPVLGQHSG